MIPLTHFNQLPPDEAARLLEPCVAIDSWVTALVQARPYPDLATLHAVARQTSLAWGEPELDLALSAHPRIGEKPAARHGHAALSRQEQAAVLVGADCLAREDNRLHPFARAVRAVS